MDRKIVITGDGSPTLFVPGLDEHYHSTHGAVNESMHVFIEKGLMGVDKTDVAILEVGFGTGLNALLTLLYCQGRTVSYHGYELFPLSAQEVNLLNFSDSSVAKHAHVLTKMHQLPWGIEVLVEPHFALTKINAKIQELAVQDRYDLVYFDAFAPNKQSDMWTEDVFKRVYSAMKRNSVLTTYCAKGEVRRIMQRVGFAVERVPGPPLKKEMLVAFKR